MIWWKGREMLPKVGEPEFDMFVYGAEGHLQVGRVEDGDHAELLVAEHHTHVKYSRTTTDIQIQLKHGQQTGIY
jgi:hypothetical protein